MIDINLASIPFKTNHGVKFMHLYTEEEKNNIKFVDSLLQLKLKVLEEANDPKNDFINELANRVIEASKTDKKFAKKALTFLIRVSTKIDNLEYFFYKSLSENFHDVSSFQCPTVETEDIENIEDIKILNIAVARETNKRFLQRIESL